MSGLSGDLRQISQPAVDLDRAIAFYRDVLGLEPLVRTSAWLSSATRKATCWRSPAANPRAPICNQS